MGCPWYKMYYAESLSLIEFENRKKSCDAKRRNIITGKQRQVRNSAY